MPPLRRVEPDRRAPVLPVLHRSALMRFEIIASRTTLARYDRFVQETRDNDSMRAWARGASGGELRAVRSQAEREGDTALVAVIRRELGRRGL